MTSMRYFDKIDHATTSAHATDRSVLGSMNVAGSDLSFTLEFEEKALDPIAIAGRLNKRPAMAGKVLIWPEVFGDILLVPPVKTNNIFFSINKDVLSALSRTISSCASMRMLVYLLDDSLT